MYEILLYGRNRTEAQMSLSAMQCSSQLHQVWFILKHKQMNLLFVKRKGLLTIHQFFDIVYVSQLVVSHQFQLNTKVSVTTQRGFHRERNILSPLRFSNLSLP